VGRSCGRAAGYVHGFATATAGRGAADAGVAGRSGATEPAVDQRLGAEHQPDRSRGHRRVAGWGAGHSRAGARCVRGGDPWPRSCRRRAGSLGRQDAGRPGEPRRDGDGHRRVGSPLGLAVPGHRSWPIGAHVLQVRLDIADRGAAVHGAGDTQRCELFIPSPSNGTVDRIQRRIVSSSEEARIRNPSCPGHGMMGCWRMSL
jgi:hypothetical protein